jgi:predicted small secreted protein
MNSKIFCLLSLLTLVLTLTGCYTIRGIGQDVEAAGGAVEETAEETRGY